MGIGYSRPSRPSTDPPSTQSVHPLGISSKVNEPASENSLISEPSKHPAADTALLDTSSSQQAYRPSGSDNESVPLIEDRSSEKNATVKKKKSSKSVNPTPVSGKRPHSALTDETVAGPSQSSIQHNHSNQPLPKRPKKAAATYVTEPVRLENATRTQATIAPSMTNALAAGPASIATMAMIEREDGELTDEDSNPPLQSPSLPISQQPFAATHRPIPTRPAANLRRGRYIDRDALPTRPAAAGMATVSSQRARIAAAIVATAPISDSSNQTLVRPKDTSSGLPYDDVYAEPTPQQSSNPLGRKGSSPYSSHLTPWAPGAVVQRMTAQGSPHHLTTGPNESHAYAYAPHFYQQYSPFAPYQLEQQAEPENGSLKSQDSGVEYNRYNDHRLNSDEDEDVDDQGNSLSRSEVIPPTN